MMRGRWWAGCRVLLALTAVLGGEQALAQGELEVIKVVLAEPKLEPGDEQLVQISLRSHAKRSMEVGIRVGIRTNRNRGTGIGRKRRLQLPAGAERRVFLRMPAPAKPGPYRVRVWVLSPDFKRNLFADKTIFSASFTVKGDVIPPRIALSPRSNDPDSASRRVPDFKAPQGLAFEKPDLLWETMRVSPKHILVGETLHIKGTLRNVGGDIARNIKVACNYYSIRLKRRRLVAGTASVRVLAPGEKRELEFAFRFPDDGLPGNYHFSLEADTGRNVAESDERNNKESTRYPVPINNILNTFPEPGFAFDRTGLFLFRWKSVLYDEFKVQVGTEAGFQKPEQYFDLPQGEKWSKEQEVVPLVGELPGMLLRLMERYKAKNVYWRVMGRVSASGKVGFSEAQSFTIHSEEDIRPQPSPPPERKPLKSGVGS